ncbi:MAG TPA: CBS domain-containing protein [Myxococcota bacterium]|jgi:CBS-domain-containing membrane protein|nr:CBS domain-containing protein [Myxococcota bacterium]
MFVEHLMTKDVWACTPTDSLREAARIMWERDCGCVPVVEGGGSGRLVGIVTDRDACMCEYLQHRPLEELHVADAMTHDVRVCHPSDPVQDAESTMREAHVRRLPVVDDAGQLLGLLSLADIAREAAHESGGKRIDLSLDEVAQTLGAVVEERRHEA